MTDKAGDLLARCKTFIGDSLGDPELISIQLERFMRSELALAAKPAGELTEHAVRMAIHEILPSLYGQISDCGFKMLMERLRAAAKPQPAQVSMEGEPRRAVTAQTDTEHFHSPEPRSGLLELRTGGIYECVEEVPHGLRWILRLSRVRLEEILQAEINRAAQPAQGERAGKVSE